MQRQLFEYQPTFGYRFIPGLRARVEHEGGGYLVKVNHEGFRCEHEFDANKTPEKRRVLLFGDSYTAGDGVSNSARYGDVLEGLLGDTEVFNFGLSGTGTDQQYLIFREYAQRIEHDAILIGVLVENIRRVAAKYREFASSDGERLVLAKPYFARNEQSHTLELRHVPVPKDPIPEAQLGDEVNSIDRAGRFSLLRSAVNKMGHTAKDAVQRLTRYQPLPAFDSSEHPDWQLMRAILCKWVSESAKPVVICPIPLYQYIEDTSSPDGYRARFKELQDHGSTNGWQLTVHDPLDDFRHHSMSQRREFRFKTDCHLTPLAHRVLAESLAPAIRQALSCGKGDVR